MLITSIFRVEIARLEKQTANEREKYQRSTRSMSSTLSTPPLLDIQHEVGTKLFKCAATPTHLGWLHISTVHNIISMTVLERNTLTTLFRRCCISIHLYYQLFGNKSNNDLISFTKESDLLNLLLNPKNSNYFQFLIKLRSCYHVPSKISRIETFYIVTIT